MNEQMEQSDKRADFIRMYRRKLRGELDAMGYPGGKLPQAYTIEKVRPANFAEVDDSTKAQRVSLIR